MENIKKQYFYLLEKVCPFCQKVFMTKNRGIGTARFCSRSCSPRFYQQKKEVKEKIAETKRKTRLLNTEERECLICGKFFTVLSREKKRFCSRSCSAKWRMGQPEVREKVYSKKVREKQAIS